MWYWCDIECMWYSTIYAFESHAPESTVVQQIPIQTQDLLHNPLEIKAEPEQRFIFRLSPSSLAVGPSFFIQYRQIWRTQCIILYRNHLSISS